MKKVFTIVASVASIGLLTWLLGWPSGSKASVRRPVEPRAPTDAPDRDSGASLVELRITDEELESIIGQARQAIYRKDSEAYRTFLLRLRGCGVRAERMIHKVFMNEPADAYITILCELATEESALFFLRLANTPRLRGAVSSESAANIIKALSRNKCRVLLDNLAIFRKGLRYDTPSHFHDSIYVSMAEWGPELESFLTTVLVDGAANEHDRAAAAASLGAIGTRESADLLYKHYASEGGRAYLVGLSRLPAGLLVKAFETYCTEYPADSRSNQLIYWLLMSPDKNCSAGLLTSILENPARSEVQKIQALLAASQLGDEAAAALGRCLAAGGVDGNVKSQLLASMASLAQRGHGSYSDVSTAFRTNSETASKLALASALSGMKELIGDLAMQEELRSQAGLVSNPQPRDLAALATIRGNLAVLDKDPVGRLLELSGQFPPTSNAPDYFQEMATGAINERLAERAGDPRADRYLCAFISRSIQFEGETPARARVIRKLPKSAPAPYGQALLTLLTDELNRSRYGLAPIILEVIRRQYPEVRSSAEAAINLVSDTSRRLSLEVMIGKSRSSETPK